MLVVRRLGNDNVDDDDGNVCECLAECLRTPLSSDGVGCASGGIAFVEEDDDDGVNVNAEDGDDGKC